MAATDTPGNMRQLLTDADVEQSLRMSASVFGLPTETVIGIVQAGLPALARKAQEDPDLFSAIYAQSVTASPELMATLYAGLAESEVMQRRLTKDYRSRYGPVVDAINREAANQTGTTEAEVGKVMAMTMPALTHALGKATDGTGEAGLMAWLKALKSARDDEISRVAEPLSVELTGRITRL